MNQIPFFMCLGRKSRQFKNRSDKQGKEDTLPFLRVTFVVPVRYKTICAERYYKGNKNA